MRKLTVGEEVVILRSGQKARVLEYFDDTWIIVLAGGKEISLNRKDIEPLQHTEKTGADEAPGIVKDPLLDEQGIGLQFKEIKKMSGETNYFEVNLYNQTNENLLFDYHFFLDQTLQYRIRKESDAFSIFYLHEFKTDQLNDSPLFKISCWLKTLSEEKKNEFDAELRLRPKQYFSKIATESFKSSGCFTLEFFKDIPAFNDGGTGIEISTSKDFENAPKSEEKEHAVLVKAGMTDFIDLHAEKLIPGYQRMDAGEILQHQLRHFRRFLEQAIRYRLHKIYAVHGIGKGVLKTEIETLLQKYPEVISFNNHYTARFGFGATEILLE